MRNAGILLAALLCCLLCVGIAAAQEEIAYDEYVSEGQLRFGILEGEATLLGVGSMQAEAVFPMEIPAKVGKYPVTALADRALAWHEWKEVKLPKTLESIGVGTFMGCANLETVQLPANLKSIGANAFEDCESLLAIELPEGLEELGEGAFIGSGVTVFSISGANERYVVGTGGVLFDRKTKTLLAIPKGAINDTYAIPQGVAALGGGLFAGQASLQQMVLPEGIERIGANTFMNCENLTVVQLPQSLASIGTGAFAGCVALESIALPKDLTRIEADTFRGCRNLQTVDMGQDVRFIGAFAFAFCEALQEFHMPERLQHLGTQFLWGATGITTLTLPMTLQEMEPEALVGSSIQTLNVPPDHPAFSVREGILVDVPGKAAVYVLDRESMTEFIAPTGVEVIGASLCNGAKQLRKVILPEGVRVIEQSAFSGCTALSEVTLPSTLKLIRSIAFKECGALSELSLPEGLEEIEDAAFMSCTGLTEMVLPASLQSVGLSPFNACSRLQTITVLADDLPMAYFSPTETSKVVVRSSFFAGAHLTAMADGMQWEMLGDLPTQQHTLYFGVPEKFDAEKPFYIHKEGQDGVPVAFEGVYYADGKFASLSLGGTVEELSVLRINVPTPVKGPISTIQMGFHQFAMQSPRGYYIQVTGLKGIRKAETAPYREKPWGLSEVYDLPSYIKVWYDKKADSKKPLAMVGDAAFTYTATASNKQNVEEIAIFLPIDASALAVGESMQLETENRLTGEPVVVTVTLAAIF